MNNVHSHSWIKQVTLTISMVLASLYLGQGLIIKSRLHQLDARTLDLITLGDTCDEINCSRKWKFIPMQRFLLIGHVLRNHQIVDNTTNIQLIPISNVKGTAQDSWPTLRVYQVNPGTEYTLTATKYKTVKVDYFMGMLPRTTDHEGVLSIPDIGPTISMISGLGLTFLLGLVFIAAFLGNSGTQNRDSSGKSLIMFAVAGTFSIIACFISLGIVDTLLPEGDFRNRLLRTSHMIASILPIFAASINRSKGHFWTRLFLLLSISTISVVLAWPWIRGGSSYALVLLTVSFVGVLIFSRNKFYAASVCWIGFVLDGIKISGLFSFNDYPPIYFGNVFSFCAFISVAGELGGFSTIAMAAAAYRRFRRDLVLDQLQKSLESNETDGDATNRLMNLQNILGDVANLTGSGRVTLTVSLPLGRPITQKYDRDDNQVTIFDDGKIPGAVTLRTMVYGDEAVFESFDEFADRLKLPRNTQLSGASYFCALPLRVNQQIIGTLMLTRFDDAYIKRQRDVGGTNNLTEQRETIRMLGDRLSHAISTLMVQTLANSSANSQKLQSLMHRIIAISGDAEEFMVRFADSVGSLYESIVMIHEQVGYEGRALFQAGMTPEHWSFFVERPFNLSPSAKTSYGMSVVAFRDGKSSYLKDIQGILNNLHPQSQDIFTRMDVLSVVAVPLKTTNRSFVITVCNRRNQRPLDPTLVSVLEGSEALFVAAIEVMSQKTSVMALGQLASRLIGDDEVREKILAAAKSKSLPTTIGSARVSFLLLIDLMGSSDLPQDTETKARAYGEFYDAVNKKSLETLGGMIRKTIGDAVIITWDGSDRTLEDEPSLLSNLHQLVSYSHQVACRIGCKGARVILHHGQYFLGLVGTNTFGQIDVIGSGIDEVCKMEGNMKKIRLPNGAPNIAFSSRAIAMLPNLNLILKSDSNYQAITDHVTGQSSKGDSRQSISFAAFINTTIEGEHDAA
jgi:class 3 adenylate cyclase